VEEMALAELDTEAGGSVAAVSETEGT
jgi:hypothetical protein